MAKFDPLEETQENLHPVIVAHRAREAAAAPPQVARASQETSRRRLATLAVLGLGAALLIWLLLPGHA